MKTIFTTLCAILIAIPHAKSSEGRIEISQSMIPLTITNSESYIVTQPLSGKNGQNGIIIAADNVTIDLNGFELAGVAGSLNGIISSGNRANITIKNGSIHDWGSIGVAMATASNSSLKDLQISNNGGNGLQIGSSSSILDTMALENSGDGIISGSSCILTRCISKNNTGNGIVTGDSSKINQSTTRENGADGFNTGAGSAITGCASRDNDNDGITAGVSSLITGCTSYGNSGDGIIITAGGKVMDCVVYENDYGIKATTGALVTSCTVKSNSDGGIFATSYCYIKQNICNNHAAVAGILVTGSGSRIEENHVTNNKYGIRVPINNSGNIIVKNTATDNTTANYDIANGNHYEIQSNPGSSFTSEPWKNFEF